MLRNVFSRFGNLIDIYLLPNKNCGYAKYASEESCQKAIETLHGAEICGVRMRVMEAEELSSDRKRLRRDEWCWWWVVPRSYVVLLSSERTSYHLHQYVRLQCSTHKQSQYLNVSVHRLLYFTLCSLTGRKQRWRYYSDYYLTQEADEDRTQEVHVQQQPPPHLFS